MNSAVSIKENFRLRILTAVLLLLVSGTGAIAQKNWEHTPAQQWTLADVQNLLGESPWAQTQSRESISSPPLTSTAPFDSGGVTVRLRSALPIRIALVRGRQIKANYEKMSSSEKAEFDTKAMPVIECPGCADNYIVTLSPPGDRRSGVPTVLRQMSLAALKIYITLTNERGETRELVHFDPPKTDGSEAVFFFSRFDQKGAPLFDTSTKKIILYFDAKVFSSDISVPKKFEFDVSRITVNGNVLF